MEMVYLSGACVSGLSLLLFGTAIILPLQGHGSNPKQSVRVLTILIFLSVVMLFLTVPAVLKMK